MRPRSVARRRRFASIGRSSRPSFVPELGRIKLSKLTARDLDRLYAKLTAKGNKATTVRRVHSLIGAALHQAERWELVDRNVSRSATPPPVHAAEVTAPESRRGTTRSSKSPRRSNRLSQCCYSSPLSLAPVVGELCALRWSDVDWQAGTLRIARSVYETAGGGWAEKSTKTHQVRRIGLDELGLAILRRHRASVDALAAELDVIVAPDAFHLLALPCRPRADPARRPNQVHGACRREGWRRYPPSRAAALLRHAGHRRRIRRRDRRRQARPR